MASPRAGSRCREVRRLLWPRDVPREYADGEEEARRHLEGCGACRAFFRRDRAVERAVRRHGGRAVAPKALREDVYDALARERALRTRSGDGEGGPADAPGARGRWRAAAVAGLGAVLLAGVALVVAGGASGDDYARDFASRAVEEDLIRTSEPAAVARFFMKEMGMGLTPVALEGGELSRAMICLIRGERAAMVEYEWRGHTVAHYRLPLSPDGRTRGGRGAPGGARLQTSADRGIHVVRWEDGRFEHAVVSELPAAQLLGLVRSGFLEP